VNGSIATALTGAAQEARMVARNAMRHGLALMLGGLIGAAGLGFLTASAFLALEASFGAATAALVVGIALSILAGGGLAFAQGRQPGNLPAGEAAPRLVAEAPPPPDAVPLLAFTAAFVLARYLSGRLRG
jgi:hypothetical protein